MQQSCLPVHQNFEATFQLVVALGYPRSEQTLWARGAVCCSRLLTFTSTLRQQGRDVWQILEQDWIAHQRDRVIPSLLLDP